MRGVRSFDSSSSTCGNAVLKALGPLRIAMLPSVNYLGRRIDSSELLPVLNLLPHVVCYPSDCLAGAAQRDEANQHDDTQGVG